MLQLPDLNLYPEPDPDPPTTSIFIFQPKPEPLADPHPPIFHFSDASPSISFSKPANAFSDRRSRNPENQTTAAAGKYHPRSSELARFTDLNPNENSHFRHLTRRTRILFDSLRVSAIADDERLADATAPAPPSRRTRGDLKASTLMRQRNLWLNRDRRIVGAVPGVPIGDVFFFRMELCVVGLHGQPQAGIDYLPAAQSANGEPIATSVIVSGGYEDNEDAGDVIIYTGHGGQDKRNRQHVHQKLECGNLALQTSMHYNIEVRVIRGFKLDGSISGRVYVYDGLYKVTDSWFEIGKSGFGVFKFKLIRIENQPIMGSVVMKFSQSLRACPLELRPQGYISLDISRKKENHQVFLYNDIDNNHDPLYHNYLTSSVFPPQIYHNKSPGCKCVGGCTITNKSCLCVTRNGGEFVYDSHGILLRGKPLVFECGPYCLCPPTCRNRVAQKGVTHQLEVFRREASWGLRCLDLIPAGSFICEYSGVVLTQEQACLMTVNRDNLVYPRRFAERWKEWGDVSRIFGNYVCPGYPSAAPMDFAMDVSEMKNVACYVSHSLTPNAFVQLVLYDHNSVLFPRVMVFAMENIPPMREISLDYGVLADSDDCMMKKGISSSSS